MDDAPIFLNSMTAMKLTCLVCSPWVYLKSWPMVATLYFYQKLMVVTVIIAWSHAFSLAFTITKMPALNAGERAGQFWMTVCRSESVSGGRAPTELDSAPANSDFEGFQLVFTSSSSPFSATFISLVGISLSSRVLFLANDGAAAPFTKLVTNMPFKVFAELDRQIIVVSCVQIWCVMKRILSRSPANFIWT